jgi:hypothetical protein
LIRKKWKYDDEKQEGTYVEHDESNYGFDCLDDYVEIEDGFTLDHLCSLVYNDLDILDATFKNCFVRSYINDWQNIHALHYTEPTREYDPDGLEWLELYWSDEVYNGYVTSGQYPHFHGIGWELKEDKYEDYHDGPMWTKGQRIHWSVSFMPMKDMLHLPIKINEDYVVYDKNEVTFRAKKKMTLRDIIGGSFWEISFYGDRESTEKQKAEIDKNIEELKVTLKGENDD